MSNEEGAILWRSLERVPVLYREPLGLFYREDHSLARVAEVLEISEDTAKQRLSRGRKLLHAQVIGVVERALEQSRPGKAFTLGVLAALPIFETSASAATLGATAVKGTAAAKSAALLGLFGAIAGPLVGLLGGWLGVKASLENAHSEAERRLIRRFACVESVWGARRWAWSVWGELLWAC